MGYILVYVYLSAFSAAVFQDVLYFLPDYSRIKSELRIAVATHYFKLLISVHYKSNDMPYYHDFTLLLFKMFFLNLAALSSEMPPTK